MKKLDFAPVTASNGLVFEEKTFQHISDGHKDSYVSLIKSIIPVDWHTSKLVVLYGCIATGTNPGARTLTEGAVYYNGEFYQVPSASFSTTGSQIGIWTISDVDSGTDESTIKTSSSSFLDHVMVNDKFVFSAGLSGTGDFDETSSNIKTINDGILQKSNIQKNQIISQIGSWDMDTDATKTISLASLGVEYVDVVHVTAIIINDSNDKKLSLDYAATISPSGNIETNTTNIVLTRQSPGTFDSTDYNGSSNRGYLIIDYIS